MVEEPGKPASKREGWWSALNKPIPVLLIGALALTIPAKWYADHQAKLVDQASRRVALGELLAEFQHRISELSAADAELDPMLGKAPLMLPAKNLDPCDQVASAKRERLMLRVGEKEVATLTGGANYLATSPEYSHVNIQTIAVQIEGASGVPNYWLNSLSMLKFLEAPPEVEWIFMRSILPKLDRFNTGMHILYAFGEIPLSRGDGLTRRQEDVLGIPNFTPAQAAKLRKDNDSLAVKVTQSSTTSTCRNHSGHGERDRDSRHIGSFR